MILCVGIGVAAAAVLAFCNGKLPLGLVLSIVAVLCGLEWHLRGDRARPPDTRDK